MQENYRCNEETALVMIQAVLLIIMLAAQTPRQCMLYMCQDQKGLQQRFPSIYAAASGPYTKACITYV